MSRRLRLVLPSVPMHITQRGVARCPTFHAEEDFAMYLWALRMASVEAKCALHAYVLMTNHVHLLLTPADNRGPERLMRSIGRRYVRYFNDRQRRTGTLWEGRYRSSIVDSTRYFFACSRYIELNPVRAGLADDPIAYAWSSFRHNACGDEDPIITPHQLYTALGANRLSRCAAYRAFFATDLEPREAAAIRAAPRARGPVLDAAGGQAVEGANAGPVPTGSHSGVARPLGLLPVVDETPTERPGSRAPSFRRLG